MSNEWYYDFKDLSTTIRSLLGKAGTSFSLSEFHWIKDICATRISMFKYKNIEEKCVGLTSEILEKALMFSYRLCFYYNAGLQTWQLCRYDFSSLGQYLVPETVSLRTLKGDTVATSVPYKDIVLVRDNDLDVPPFLCILEYLTKINKIERTMFKVLRNACLPLLITGTKKQVNQLKVLDEKFDSDSPSIIGDDKLIDGVKAFNISLDVPPGDIYDLRMKYRNELLASLGIYGIDSKRERMVTGEVSAINDFTDMTYQASKMPREHFCEPVGLELVETYDVNYQENTELEADKAGAIAEAEAAGELEGNPNAGKVMTPPGGKPHVN